MSTPIHGFCDERFAPLRDAFARNFADGFEVGASLAVTHHGRLVVDLWAGHRDGARTQPWERDTIAPVASTAKVMSALCALVLIDRGALDLDAPVAHYWPEFAAGGKHAVTVRDALTHQAGVPGLQGPISLASAGDWDTVSARLAAEPHWFNGVRRVWYHLITFGLLIGELIRRVDGRTIAQFFEDEIASKAGADFQLGLRDPGQLERLAVPYLAGASARAQIEPIDQLAEAFFGVDKSRWGPFFKLGCNGYGNGRSIAHVGSILANGGVVNTMRILGPEVVALAGREHAVGVCPHVGYLRLGLGLALDSALFPAPSPTSLHWGGLGGSQAIMDPHAGVSLGYAPNNWSHWELRDGKLVDRRLKRFFAALSGVLRELGGSR